MNDFHLAEVLVGVLVVVLAAGVVGLFTMAFKLSAFSQAIEGIKQWQEQHEKLDDERLTMIRSQLDGIWKKLDGDNALAKALSELAQVIKEITKIRH